ncbi:MAG: inosine monophosphate cyclohydrolase [Firmicutes bacterium HGW-Firmicutes-9]|jgi:IMP cyclohydrolase|nr:MAG: inosine monophosphate cyclohydrolase [Firmicutes bacterium HGW-Firmicutes-9]
MVSIANALKENRYPGRGILLGSIGRQAVTAYFLTGRSENSQNRIFREDGDTLLILPFDESKISDPKLIFYTPIRICNGAIVVTNGDHTETVCESLLAGHSFQYAMSARCYEPDAPNYTPRIAGLMLSTGRYTLGIVKKMVDADDCRRKYWSFDAKEGVAHMIHTYQNDGDPLPPFEGEPREIAVFGTAESLAEEIWSALDKDNRVSLYVRLTDLSNGRFTSVVKNKMLGD